jgi:membrane-associated protease RseP (regulator of RpoE activity)
LFFPRDKEIAMVRKAFVGSVALALLFAAAARADQPTGNLERTLVVTTLQAEPEANPAEVAPAVTLSDYWIGVACQSPVSDALRAHLDLPDEQGILIVSVVSGGPSEKAGIKEHDVLWKIDGKPLAGIQDLRDAIDEAKDEKELSVELVRGGKRETVTVQPAKRPESVMIEEAPSAPDDPWRSLRGWLESQQLGKGRRPPLRFRFVQPGVILPRGAAARPPLPGNMTVTIKKHGDEPAQITVERDGEKWETTEKELDKLPDDVRPHVEAMLGTLPDDVQGRLKSHEFHVAPEVTVPAPFGEDAKAWFDGSTLEKLNQRLEEQMDRLNRRVDELQKQLRDSAEQLRDSAEHLREEVRASLKELREEALDDDRPSE